jgi:ribosomal protein S21
MINAEVVKNNNESSLALLRRFNKRVQGARIVNEFKGRRFKDRNQSHYKIKRSALNKLERRAEFEKLIKLGKIQEKTSIKK